MSAVFHDVTILIVDSNFGMRSILAAVLRALGFPTVRMADNGQAALHLVPEVRPDLIITDLKMPVMDGLQFVRALRANVESQYSTVPIIVATGHTEEKHVRACLAAGVDQFMAKPITGRSMANRIQRVIHEDREFVRTADYAGPRRGLACAEPPPVAKPID